MAPFLRDIRSTAKAATLAAVFLLAFSLYGLYCINTVNEVKINGPAYRDIVRSRDVVADVLPPPEYLVEAFLTAYQMLDAADGAEPAALAERAGRLDAEYRQRHAYWLDSLPPGPLRGMLTDSAFRPGDRMLLAMKDRFLPAVRAGDKAAARAVLDSEIRPAYGEHRAGIDAVVVLAKRRQLEAETRVEVAVRSRTYGQIAIGILLFAFLSLFSSYVVSQERKSLEAERSGEKDPGKDPGKDPEEDPEEDPAPAGAGTRG